MDEAKPKKRRTRKKVADPFLEQEQALEREYEKRLREQKMRLEQGPPADVRARLGISEAWKPHVTDDGRIVLDPDDYYHIQFVQEKVGKLHAQINRLEADQRAADGQLAALDAQLRAAIQKHGSDKRDRDAKLAELKADLIKVQSEELPGVRERVREKYGLGSGQLMVGDDRTIVVDNETKDGGAE